MFVQSVVERMLIFLKKILVNITEYQRSAAVNQEGIRLNNVTTLTDVLCDGLPYV